MILMPQILDITANENVLYKRNELEWKTQVLGVPGLRHANVFSPKWKLFTKTMSIILLTA